MFHQTLQQERLDGSVFAGVAAAQAVVDAWVVEYNHDRPHQSLDMASPAKRFNEARAAGVPTLAAPRRYGD